MGCQASPLLCDDGNACTVDGCDPASGCTAVPGSGTCDDGNPCTAEDACSGGVCSGVPVVVPEVSDLRLARPGGLTQLSWAAPTGPSTTYDLVSGPVSELGGPGVIPTAACVRNDLTDPSTDDPGPDPAESQAIYYLVRAAGACGVGPYGQASSGTPRTPTAGCP
jgi:hypothetical protein